MIVKDYITPAERTNKESKVLSIFNCVITVLVIALLFYDLYIITS